MYNTGYMHSIRNDIHYSFPLQMPHSQNPPNREPRIPRYFAVQIQIEILVEFGIVLRNLRFSIWWISRHFQWNRSYIHLISYFPGYSIYVSNTQYSICNAQ